MKVVTAKFSKNELNHILNNCVAKVGNIDGLEMYNEANYFQIKQLYSNDSLVGYAIIFLGYNGIETNDVSLEDIVYWGNENNYIESMNSLLEEIKNSTEYPFPVSNIYYDENKYYGIGIILETLGYQPKGLTR